MTTPNTAGLPELISQWRRYTEGNYDDAANARARCADELESALARQEPWGWGVVGTRHIFFGEYAQQDAEREAKHCGGSARAFALYAAPAPERPAVDLEQLRALIASAARLFDIGLPGRCRKKLDDALALIDGQKERSNG